MKISSKGKYALQLLIFLAQNQQKSFISLSYISEKTGISKKYLEQIVSILNKTDFLEANRGFQGGYKLAKKPDEITIYDVLQTTESSFFKNDYSNFNEQNDNFYLTEMFKKLDKTICDYLKSVTIEDIKNKENERLINNYVI